MQRLRDDAGVVCLQLHRELLDDVLDVPLGDFGAVRQELPRLAEYEIVTHTTVEEIGQREAAVPGPTMAQSPFKRNLKPPGRR